MKHTKRKLAGLALASSLILATAASAKIPVGKYAEISGYLGASARYQKADFGQGEADGSTSQMDLDAVKLSADLKYEEFTARISAYAPGSTLDPYNSDEIFISEAFLSYNFGKGYTVSGGRFLSWIGYEPFDLDQQWTLTSGLGPMGALVPNYHNGARLEYTAGKISLGVAVLDSVYNDEFSVFSLLGAPAGIDKAYQGDADVRNGLGGEFMIRYQDEAFSFGATLATEWNNDAFGDAGVLDYTLYVADLWAQYHIARTKTTMGAEFIYRRLSLKESSSASLMIGDEDNTAYAVLLSIRQPVMERLSVAGSVSFGTHKWMDTLLRYQKVAVAPTYVLSEHIEARAELSWTNYDNDRVGKLKNVSFAGVQMVVSF